MTITVQEEMSAKTIVKLLRRCAELDVEDRKIAEFGPGGGNPNAKVEDHLEWQAAQCIQKLLDDNKRLRAMLGSSGDDA